MVIDGCSFDFIAVTVAKFRYFAYGPQTANLAEVFMSMMVAQFVAVKTGEWHKIWKPKPLKLVSRMFGAWFFFKLFGCLDAMVWRARWGRGFSGSFGFAFMREAS